MTDLSRSTLEADLAHYRQSGDFAAQAETLMALAEIANKEEEYSIAQGLYGQAAVVYEQIQNWRRMTIALSRVARALDYETQPLEVQALYQSAFQLCDAVGDVKTKAALLMWLAKTADTYADSTTMLSAYEAAAACFVVLGRPKAELHVIFQFTHLVSIEDALAWYERAIDLAHSVKNVFRERMAYHEWTRVAARQNDLAVINACFERAYDFFTQNGMTRDVLDILKHTLDVTRLHKRDYPSYRYWHTRHLSIFFQHSPAERVNMNAYWPDLADIAAQAGDFATARMAYQRMVMECVARRESYQSWIYWYWGQMEYSQSGRREMGLALCQWALTLMERDKPEIFSHYQRQLDQMRQDLHSPQNLRK